MWCFFGVVGGAGLKAPSEENKQPSELTRLSWLEFSSFSNVQICCDPPRMEPGCVAASTRKLLQLGGSCPRSRPTADVTRTGD